MNPGVHALLANDEYYPVPGTPSVVAKHTSTFAPSDGVSPRLFERLFCTCLHRFGQVGLDESWRARIDNERHVPPCLLHSVDIPRSFHGSVSSHVRRPGQISGGKDVRDGATAARSNGEAFIGQSRNLGSVALLMLKYLALGATLRDKRRPRHIRRLTIFP